MFAVQMWILILFVQRIQSDLPGLMELMLQEGTCYTDMNILCVTFPETHANGAEFNVPNYHPLFYDLNKNIPFEVRDSNGVRVIHTAYILSQYVVKPIAGRKLGDVVHECRMKDLHEEGYARLINAIESAAVSAVSDFCELSVKLLADLILMMDACETFNNLLILIQKTFTQYRIPFEPIQQVRDTVHLMLAQSHPEQQKVNDFFVSVCNEFTERFDNMAGLLNKGEHFKLDNNSLAEVLTVLKTNIIREEIIFADDSDD